MMTGIDTKKCYGQIFLTSRMSQRTQFVKKQQRHSLLFNKLCKTSSVLLIQRHAIWLTNCAHRGRVAHSPAVSTGSWTDFLEARIKSKLGRGAAQQAESSPLMHERAVITDPGPVFDVPLSLSDVFLSSCQWLTHRVMGLSESDTLQCEGHWPPELLLCGRWPSLAPYLSLLYHTHYTKGYMLIDRESEGQTHTHTHTKRHQTIFSSPSCATLL